MFRRSFRVEGTFHLRKGSKELFCLARMCMAMIEQWYFNPQKNIKESSHWINEDTDTQSQGEGGTTSPRTGSSCITKTPVWGTACPLCSITSFLNLTGHKDLTSVFPQPLALFKQCSLRNVGSKQAATPEQWERFHPCPCPLCGIKQVAPHVWTAKIFQRLTLAKSLQAPYLNYALPSTAPIAATGRGLIFRPQPRTQRNAHP